MDRIDAAVDATKHIVGQDEQLIEIFRKYLEMDTDKNKDNAGYQAWAGMALDASIAIANLFISVQKPNSGRSYRAICDLTYNLHSNEFWSRNSNFLMPLLIIALNSHKNYIEAKVEYKLNSEYAVYDKVMSSSQCMPLEIFCAILYLVGGPSLMAICSLPMKLDLAPYFVS